MNETVYLRAFEDNIGLGGEVELASNDPSRYMNFYWRFNDTTVHADDAKALRDALIAVYPLEAPKKPKRPHGAQEYKGNGKHDWEPVIGETERLRVPGGWLYQGKYDTVFVPVPEAVGYVV